MSTGEDESAARAEPLSGAAGISFVLPIHTVSESNCHEHWRNRQRRAKLQRGVSAVMSGPHLRAAGYLGVFERESPNLSVTLTRIAPRSLDSDNLAGSQKHVRDGIADCLGIDDRDKRVTWTYGQRKGAAKTYAVEVKVVSCAESCA